MRTVALALSELPGRPTTQQGRDHLKAKGLMPDREELADEAELEYTRRGFRFSRKIQEHDEENDLPLFFNLPEVKEDGTTVEYFGKSHEATLHEAVQYLEYWHKYRKVADKKLRFWYREFSKYHDPSEIRRLLTFEILPEIAGV